MALQFYNRDGSPILPEEGETQDDFMLRWMKQFEDGNRVVRQTRLPISQYFVSTIFLGLNHNFNPLDERPKIFETIIFDREQDKHKLKPILHQERYATEEEARLGHWVGVWVYFWIGIQNRFTSLFTSQMQ